MCFLLHWSLQVDEHIAKDCSSDKAKKVCPCVYVYMYGWLVR